MTIFRLLLASYFFLFVENHPEWMRSDLNKQHGVGFDFRGRMDIGAILLLLLLDEGPTEQAIQSER